MTAAIIQARMGSTRLPGKIMKELAGKPMLWHVVERAGSAAELDKIIVATTANREDDAVEKFCRENNFLFFRGPDEDVLARYYLAAKEYKVSTIARITADCPLIAPEIIDECVQNFAAGRCDYISNINPGERTFPRGLDVEVFSFDALEKAFREAVEPYEREHVTPYIWQNKKNEFKIGSMITATPSYARPQYRLTVAFPEDFELMEKIYGEFYKPGKIIDIPDVLRFLDARPEIVTVNAHCEEKQVKI